LVLSGRAEERRRKVVIRGCDLLQIKVVGGDDIIDNVANLVFHVSPPIRIHHVQNDVSGALRNYYRSPNRRVSNARPFLHIYVHVACSNKNDLGL
jgi:hypothetical protein